MRSTVSIGHLGVIAICIATTGIPPVSAEERSQEGPAITAIEPAALVGGSKATLKIRGFRLKEAAELRFPHAPGVVAEIKERKDASQPKGLENKVAGDCQLLAEITLPPGLTPGMLEYVVVTKTGEVSGKVAVLDPAAAIEETEPNSGFRETQALRPGQWLRGAFQGEKDVDVYQLSAKAGQSLVIRVVGGSSLLMDPSVHCYDARWNFLAAADDGVTRDPVLTFPLTSDGPVYICLSDAHDGGGEWHGYLLVVETNGEGGK